MSLFFRNSTSILRGSFLRPTNLLRLQRNLSTEYRKKIDDAVKTNPLVIFMKGTPESPMCGYSKAVIQIMQIQGIQPEKLKSFNCLEDQELRDCIKEYSDWPTIPQVYVNGEFVGGCDIMINMHQSGELEDLLHKHDLLLPLEEESKSE